ncbi:hypothetical protein [Tessaracoccus sp.]
MSELPYTDAKPVGAADFYFGINATFAHIKERYGMEGLHAYWEGLGRDYQRPVWQRWAEGGLPAVAEYWETFFSHEPGAEVAVSHAGDDVVLEVIRCPAIAHLRANDREILPQFCHHCAVMGDAAAGQAGLQVRVVGGNGSCVQKFTARTDSGGQDFSEITSCGGAC